MVPNRIWLCLVKFEGHQTFDQNLKLFLQLRSQGLFPGLGVGQEKTPPPSQGKDPGNEVVISFVLEFDGRCFLCLDSRVSNMFNAGMHITLAQRLVCV